jgi:hypothetical protein
MLRWTGGWVGERRSRNFLLEDFIWSAFEVRLIKCEANTQQPESWSSSAPTRRDNKSCCCAPLLWQIIYSRVRKACV